MEQEKRKALEAYYEGLPPEERRSRIILKPEFRDAYNELVEADRQFPVPQYLWQKWVPVVGLFPVAVYLELRRMCFVNRATGERRDWCWPRQETIARRLGVRKRHTVGKALEVLEARGFIKREPSYHRRGADALVKRGADRYLVYFEVPLVPADAAELLLRRVSSADEDGGSWREAGTDARETSATPFVAEENPDMAAERPHRGEAVHELSDMAAKRPYAAGRQTASRNVTRTITKNVMNVGTPEGRERPRAAEGAALAFEIGESLKTWAGENRRGAHPSEGFHRRVISRMPERLVREALAATRDAVERRRGGQGGCVRGPAAYFAGVVKKLAEDNGIDLGLRKRDEHREELPRKRTGLAPLLRPDAIEARSMDDAPMSVEASKAALKDLIESLAVKRM